MTSTSDEIKAHYVRNWQNTFVVRKWQRGPISELPPQFSVLEFAPSHPKRAWTYATCCMSQLSGGEAIELHLFSPVQCDLHIELLTAIAHYHNRVRRLRVGHTVNFGRPWLLGSNCDYGLISLPYLDGPSLEELRSACGGSLIRFLWLLPITRSERDYKRAYGLEALEREFENARFDYLNPARPSVV
jgi:hypothetical protein